MKASILIQALQSEIDAEGDFDVIAMRKQTGHEITGVFTLDKIFDERGIETEESYICLDIQDIK